MVVNAMLGTVLWTTYAEAYSVIEPNLQHHPLMGAALSGGIAGGVQALIAAPAENVRLAIEGGTAGHSWAQAWRSTMRNSPAIARKSRGTQIQEAREYRKWMREVGDMAGRGWSGWGWGCAKDVCGMWLAQLASLLVPYSMICLHGVLAFSAFFAIFEVTRRVGQAAKARSEDLISHVDKSGTRFVSIKHQAPRFLNSVILVSGGVSLATSFP